MENNPRAELGRMAADLRQHVLKKGAALPAGRVRATAVKAARAKAAAPTMVLETAPPPAKPGKKDTAQKGLYQASPGHDWPFLDSDISKAEKLAKLREYIGDCQRCPLGKSRITLVFGVGNPEAKVMFVGEGPGFQEDRKGEPFVGPAGQLLDKILASIGLSRQPTAEPWQQVFIANVAKCHPMIDPTDNTQRGNDRPPTPEEMATCSPFLLGQIRIIRPLFIVGLGATANKALLQTEEGISKFRGKWADFSPDGGALKVRLMPTYHPAALLRNPNLKKDVWEDMKNLKAALEAAVKN